MAGRDPGVQPFNLKSLLKDQKPRVESQNQPPTGSLLKEVSYKENGYVHDLRRMGAWYTRAAFGVKYAAWA